MCKTRDAKWLNLQNVEMFTSRCQLDHMFLFLLKIYQMQKSESYCEKEVNKTT